MPNVLRLWAMLTLVLAAAAPSTWAAPVRFQIQGLSSLGPQVQIALDLVSANGASSNVSVGPITSNGSVALSSLTGGVQGAPGSGLQLSDAALFNEALLRVDNADGLSFVFDSSNAAPDPTGFFDTFALFLLDPASGLPAFGTTDPTGAGALFQVTFDGTASGALQTFSPAQATGVSWSLFPVVAAGVPEPASLLLVVLALLLLAGTRGATHRQMVAATLLLGASLTAQAENLTSSVRVQRGGLVLNRVSNTFDGAVTVKNISSAALLGPLKLVLASAQPANVALYNSHGRMPSGADFIVLPLETGILAPGASTTTVVRLLTANQTPASTVFELDGRRLTVGATAQINVQGVFAAGYAGPGESQVGAGFNVIVNGVLRGVTDSAGTLAVTVPAGPADVALQRAPNEGGSALLAGVAAGSVAVARVVVDDGKEISAYSRLRIDAAQQGVLARNAARIALRFMDAREQPVRLTTLYDVGLLDVLGNLKPLTSLFTLQADGSAAAAPAAFYQALSGSNGQLRLQMSGEDASGAVHTGTAAFQLADFRVRVQLVAPPSNPVLPLAGVRLTATVLNTDLRFVAQSDTNGVVVLPDLPRGNISLSSSTMGNALVYNGGGSVPLNFNALIRLTMRAPQDVLASVSPISVEPLPPTFGSAPRVAGVPAPAAQAAAAPEPTRVRRDAERSAQRSAVPPPAAMANSVSVRVVAAAQNVVVERSAQLPVPRGSKKLTLKYAVNTLEYPEYVLAQSIYNDVWSLSVVGGNGQLLFDLTRQINSQLTQPPVWLPNGSTGEIRQEVDVTALAAAADTTVVLRATSVNIGDSLLTTVVDATLDTTEPLVITAAEATAGEVTTNNAGNYYSVPRSGATNTLQRTFAVELTKPSGSTLTAVNVDLLDGANGTLMTVLRDAAPGASGVEVVQEDDTSAQLKVRVTVSSPASTVGGVPPPTRDLSYRVRVKGTDAGGNEISDEKTAGGKRALWRMPDGRARYGTRDAGGDDWAARGTYNWIVANGALLREIDDVSGEHGRDIGHATHARGTDIDMYHFYRFPGATSGTDNYNRLAADVVLAFGTLQQPNPPAAATAAFSRVAAWLAATRQGLGNLAALPSVSQLIHCNGTAVGGLGAGWCAALVQSGSVLRVNPQQTLNFGGSFANAKMSWRNDHNNHVHITLAPAQINE